MRRRPAGFSLVELIIAIALGAIVMGGLFGIMTSMIRFQTDSLRKGSVTGWALAGIVKMNKEIENANVIAWPVSGNPNSDYVVGCINWSRAASPNPVVNGVGGPGGPLDTGSPVTVFYYCYNGQGSYDGDNVHGQLRRMANTGFGVTCPMTNIFPSGLPICSASAAFQTNEVIATGVNYRLAGPNNVFAWDDSMRGIRIRFTVGKENAITPSPGNPEMVNPQFVTFNTAVIPERVYSTTVD